MVKCYFQFQFFLPLKKKIQQFTVLLLVILDTSSQSKYNELRLNKAARSPQHRNKEVGKRNKRYMQCTRQGMLLLTTVFTMVFYQLFWHVSKSFFYFASNSTNKANSFTRRNQPTPIANYFVRSNYARFSSLWILSAKIGVKIIRFRDSIR